MKILIEKEEVILRKLLALFGVLLVVAVTAVTASAKNNSSQAATKSASLVVPSLPACNGGTTVLVPGGPVGLFLYLLFHPGATSGACPAVAVPASLVGLNSGVYECNRYNGLYVISSETVKADRAVGNRGAFVVLGVKYTGASNTNPLQSGKDGELTCVVPAGVTQVKGVVTTAGGDNFYPAVLADTPGLYSVFS